MYPQHNNNKKEAYIEYIVYVNVGDRNFLMVRKKVNQS
jgi:hypothetical protein